MMSETIIDQPFNDIEYGYVPKIQRVECDTCHIKKPMATTTCRACKKQKRLSNATFTNIPSVDSVASISRFLGI